MLEKFAKAIKFHASKIGWINREIQAHNAEQTKQRIEAEEKRIAAQIEEQRISNQKAEHHHHWERIMKGQAMRDIGTEKDDDRMKAVVVDYVGRRRVGESFNPVFSRMDCLNWAERKQPT